MESTNIRSYWDAPSYLPYIQPDLTDEIIKYAENKLGVSLPKQYIEQLKIQNGGYIRYKLTGLPHDTTYGIGPYFPTITDLDWSDYLDYVSFKLDGLVPFDGDGHWFLCFDYRKNAIEPQITYIDTENDTEQIAAHSFSDYLSKLVIETDDKWVIETADNIETVVSQIESILNIKFESPDLWAHGYPIYRIAFKEGWIWMSPNKVPKGFIRKDDDRYDELIKMADGYTLRYPELYENCILISFSEEEDVKDIIDNLKTNAIKINPLSSFFEK